LLGNLPADQNLCPKRRHRQHDQILHATSVFTKTQKLYADQNACRKQGNFIFLPKPMPKKEKPILKTYKANLEHREKKTTQPIKTIAVSRQARQPTKTPAKNLEANFSDST
jgi:hypothetical protein